MIHAEVEIEDIAERLAVASGFPDLHQGKSDCRGREANQVSLALGSLSITQLAGLLRAAVVEAERRGPCASVRMRETLRQHALWPAKLQMRAGLIAEACTIVPPRKTPCELGLTGVKIWVKCSWFDGTVLLLGSVESARQMVEEMRQSNGNGGWHIVDTFVATGEDLQLCPIAAIHPSPEMPLAGAKDLLVRTGRFRVSLRQEPWVVLGSEAAMYSIFAAATSGELAVEQPCEVVLARGFNMRISLSEGTCSSGHKTVPAALASAIRVLAEEHGPAVTAELQEGGQEP